jgi:hypothetical protein
MLTPDDFLLTLYVICDDFCKAELSPPIRPGSAASLSASELITLGLFAQWGQFLSERRFYSYADRHFRSLFPRLPHRAQWNRLLRGHTDDIVKFFVHLTHLLDARSAPYQAIDCTGLVTRNYKRRGEGWFPGLADIGWSNRRGWYKGFHLLHAVTPEGVITGFGFSSASVNDHRLAETLFALRRSPASGFLRAVGEMYHGEYLADTGFSGRYISKHWKTHYGAMVLAPPQKDHPIKGFTKDLRVWIASHRQIAETVFDKLFNAFTLERSRPHALTGMQARVAAASALHNFCIWLNRQLGRPSLAFAELIDW